MDSLSDRELEQLFPKLKASGYKVTSPDSHLYNCIAWAFGDSLNWWEPTPFADYYWPDDLSRENTINTFTKLCNKFGYVKCEEGNLEVGYEKIAMYISNRTYAKINSSLTT